MRGCCPTGGWRLEAQQQSKVLVVPRLHLQLSNAVLLAGLPCIAGRTSAVHSTELRLQLPQQLILLPAEMAPATTSLIFHASN